MDLSEKLYEDFTTQVLPKIQEWLVITKDYAFELGERYITYLIVTDSLLIFLSLIPIMIFIRLSFYVIPRWDGDQVEEPIAISWFITWFCSIFAVVSVIINTWDLIKDIYIPEVRIYEEMQITK